MKCRTCRTSAEVALPSRNAAFCREHFLAYFRRQVQRAIKEHRMLAPGEKVLVCLSGGKDSLALACELSELGYAVTGLHVYLGIPGASDDSLGRIHAFCERFGIELRVADLVAEGLAIPEVKRAISRPICSMCGKIKRHMFNRAARETDFAVLATGHNLDDEVARLFVNTLRWDPAYLSDQTPALPAEDGFTRKIKPLYRLTEYETAAYSFVRGIDYVTAPCPYSRGATFSAHKQLLDDLEARQPNAKIYFYDSFLKRGRRAFQALEQEEGRALHSCPGCASPTSEELCGVCRVRDMVRAARGAEK